MPRNRQMRNIVELKLIFKSRIYAVCGQKSSTLMTLVQKYLWNSMNNPAECYRCELYGQNNNGSKYAVNSGCLLNWYKTKHILL